MSVFLINSHNEEEVHSPTTTTTTGENENSSDAEGTNLGLELQCGELTVETFWPRVTKEIQKINVVDVRNQALPLARIKKIMKLDEDVKMISAEAPMLFAKATELFIMELTLRAWMHTEDNKRRTLQHSDIAMAVTKYDQFDFLIDIVPREEAKVSINMSVPDNNRSAVNSDKVYYYFQLAQRQASNNNSNQVTSIPIANVPIQVMHSGTGKIQTVATANQSQEQSTTVTNNPGNTITVSGVGQIINLHNSNQNSLNESTNGVQLVLHKHE